MRSLFGRSALRACSGMASPFLPDQPLHTERRYACTKQSTTKPQLFSALYEMKIYPIKNEIFLQNAIKLYSEFWGRVWTGHAEKQECMFDGSSGDLGMLEYCEYEVGYPEENYDNAAIIWANVIKKNTILEWGEDKSGNIYLYSDEYPKFFINVKEYVYGVVESDISQFESFSFLTEKVAIEMLIAKFSIEDISGLKNIVFEYSSQNWDSYSDRFMWSIRELYEESVSKIDKLKSSLNGEQNI